MAEPKLKPRRLTLTADLKFWDTNLGRTSGSSISMEYDLQEDLPAAELLQQTWREKRKLDLVVLTMERLRGAISESDYKLRREELDNAYDRVITARKPKDDQPGSNSTGARDDGTAGPGPGDEAGPE